MQQSGTPSQITENECGREHVKECGSIQETIMSAVLHEGEIWTRAGETWNGCVKGGCREESLNLSC